METCNAHEVDQVALTSRLSYTFPKPWETNPGLQKRKYSFVQPIQTSKMEEFVKEKQTKDTHYLSKLSKRKEVIRELLNGRKRKKDLLSIPAQTIQTRWNPTFQNKRGNRPIQTEAS